MPPQRPRRVWLWLLPLLAVVAAAVIVPVTLTSGDEPGEQSSAPTSTRASETEDAGGGPAIPTETRTPKPKDRDPAAVTVALRQLDPCKVLDLEVAKKRQRPNAATIPLGPHSCFLAPSAEHQPGDGGGIKLFVGAWSDQMMRYKGTPIIVAGAKAYEYSNVMNSGSQCRITIPVSAVRAIELEYLELEKADLCPIVRQYAEGTVGKLRNPDALIYSDTTRPYSAWDGCTLLQHVLGEGAGKYTYDSPLGGDPFGGCVAQAEPNEDRATIQISYDFDVHKAKTSRQIAGKTVGIDDRRRDCHAAWDHGPNGNRNKWYAVTEILMTAKDCDTVAALAERVITLGGQKPPAGGTPQRPLLFGPDDNDTATVGACVDFAVTGGLEDCEPYQEVPIPRNPADILAAAPVNRHVQCAVFTDAVAEKFGEQFTPITWGGHCFFVESEHVLEIGVNVDPANRPLDYGTGDLYADRKETEVAGKAAVTFWNSTKTTFEIYLSPHDELGRRGNLHIAVEMLSGRGDYMAGAPQLPQDKADLATEVLEQVVETYFP